MAKGFLENLLDKIDEGKADELVNHVNEILLELGEAYDDTLFTHSERDALRHYLGTIELAKEYGGTVAWFSGLLHEGLDFTKSGQDYEQSIVDKENNAKALEDFEKGEFIELIDIVGDHDKLRTLINKLSVPPDIVSDPKKAVYTPTQPPARENVTTYDTGYNPVLDRTDEK
jgi:hypothetical protein